MPGLLIEDASLVLSGSVLTGYRVYCEKGLIKNVSPVSDKFTPANDTIIVNASGMYLAPGFIDLHIHGLHSYLIDNGTEDLSEMCRLLPRYGVTGFLATVCPLPKGSDAAFLSFLSKVESDATEILGFHLEGPFLTLTGALPSEALGQADLDRVKKLIEAAGPYRCIFSVSPDFEGIEQLIGEMAKDNNPVFMTHTEANVDQTCRAIESGASHATHFYDVFPCPEETDPGVRPSGAVEAILADPAVSVDFILDGEHVDPVAVRMALQCKGADKVCLITDANIGAGLEPGTYMFGKEQVSCSHAGAPARLVNNNTLAGSGLTMDQAVRNAVTMLDMDIFQAVRMASSNPAKVLGLDKSKGMISQGYDADLVLMDDNFQVLQTWVRGNCCYKA